MAVTLSSLAGAGAQFFDNNGVPLAGGLIYTYLAGTNTPAATYTSSTGLIAHSNPIVLDAAGRIATGEVWLTTGVDYKFLVKTSVGVQLGSYDNIPSINDFTSIYADLANTTNPALGDALIGFRQSNSSGNLSGAVGRTVHQKLQESISVKDFGAVGDGATDDTVAIQAAINYAATIITNGTGDLDQVSASVLFPSGKYRTTAAIQMQNCVQLHGKGSGNTWILVDHAGDGFFSATGGTYFGIQVYGIHLESGGSAQDAFVINGQIRNCYYHDVGCRGFRYSFAIEASQTVVFDQCYSFDCVSHFRIGNTGGTHIYHGRYDVASDHGVYVDGAVAELIITDAAIQFGQKSAVYVANGYTVELNQCFFEGNCIGSATDYYVYIKGNTVSTLTSASVIDCVINNLADANRNGLGILYVEEMTSFVYRERWVRNGVSVVPIIGANVNKVSVEFNSSNPRTSALTNVTVGSQSNAFVQQVARPIGIFGQDMADTSFAPTTRAALNVGRNSVGLAMGTYNEVAAINGYGASFKLQLNPAGGAVSFGQTDFAEVTAGTNEFYGRYREITQAGTGNITPLITTGFVVIDLSGGNRTVTLTNILGEYGRRFTAAKADGGGNTLTITPAAGETINGAATYTSAAAYATVSLIGINGGWVVL